MWNTKPYSEGSKWGLYLTLIIAILPVIILHFLNIYHYFIGKSIIQHDIFQVINWVKYLLFIFHVINCMCLYLVIPWTKRLKVFSTLKILPKIIKGRKESIISKDPFQKNHRYRFYINGNLIFLKVCRTWRIIRPPRSAHCYRWGQWVKDFDHHCMWLSCCIGKGNYLYFWAFLSTLNIVYLLAILLNTLIIFSPHSDSNRNEAISNLEYFPYSLFYI